MRVIELTRGKTTIVDDDVWEWASKVPWSASYSKQGGNWYAIRTVTHLDGKRKCESLHRRIIRAVGMQKTDHKDGNGLNNLRSNLRICTDRQNHHNQKLRCDNTSGFKGVSLTTRPPNRYRATIRINGRLLWLGSFESARQAANAYNMAATKYFGEFARLNPL